MGTFLGHILPGTFFFIYGLMYIIRDAFNTALRVQCKPRSHRSRASSSSHYEDDVDDPTTSRLSDTEYDTGDGIASSTSNGYEAFSSDLEDDMLLYDRTRPTVLPGDDGSPEKSSERNEKLTQDSALLSKRAHARDDVVPQTTQKSTARCKELVTDIAVIEGVLKIVCSTCGALGELWWGGWYLVSPRSGNFTNMNNWQHATMFASFGLSGVADIVSQLYKKPTMALTSTEKIFLSLAFWVECLLFYFHTHGVSELEAHMHTLLLFATFVCAAGSGLDVWLYHPDAPGVRRLWAIATCLQGSWFWQIAFVLYNPYRESGYDRGDEMLDMMMMTTMFTWHIFAVLLITLITHIVIQYCSKFKLCKN